MSIFNDGQILTGEQLNDAFAAKADARASILASETIVPNAYVNIYSSGGIVYVRLAIANDPLKFACGFAPSAIGIGTVGSVLFVGLNADATVSASASEVWLSDSTAGSYTLTPPSNAGSMIQPLGPAIAGLGVFFTLRERVGPL